MNFPYLSQREKARNDGDKLAVAVRAFLKGKAKLGALKKALMLYCVEQSWNGPAASWTKDIIAHELAMQEACQAGADQKTTEG
jgi:hypothetical protein